MRGRQLRLHDRIRLSMPEPMCNIGNISVYGLAVLEISRIDALSYLAQMGAVDKWEMGSDSDYGIDEYDTYTDPRESIISALGDEYRDVILFCCEGRVVCWYSMHPYKGPSKYINATRLAASKHGLYVPPTLKVYFRKKMVNIVYNILSVSRNVRAIPEAEPLLESAVGRAVSEVGHWGR